MNAPVEVAHRLPSAGMHRAQLSDEVAGHLRAAIMSGTLRPGTFIRLDETAAQLGVSITPVREALLTLRGEGMVRLEPHRGHVVLPLTRRDIEDIFWLQSIIAKELAATATEPSPTTRSTNSSGSTTRSRRRSRPPTPTRWSRPSSPSTAPSTGRPAGSNWPGSCCMSRGICRTLVYAADPDWGAAAVDNHRQLVAALRARDTAAVVRTDRLAVQRRGQTADGDARRSRGSGLTASGRPDSRPAS